MRKSILLIYNPASGYFINNHADSAAAFFETLLGQYSQTHQLTFFQLGSTSKESIRQCLDRLKPDEVWVAGGDGTVRSVAQETALVSIPLGVIPCGTMNLLARDIGMSLDIEQAIQQLCNAASHRIDMAELNGDSFLCISNIGMSTRLTEERERLRKNFAWVRWPLMAIYMVKFMFLYPTLSVNIKLGDKNYILQTRSISISNNLLAPQGSLLPERKKLVCGTLGIYVAEDTSVWSLPRIILRLFKRDWQDDKDLLIFKADSVRINFLKSRKKIRVMTDGELSYMEPLLEYKIKPDALIILQPNDAA